MRKEFICTIALIFTYFTACESIRTISTDTSGNVFSLNGSWQLGSSTENNAMVGTTIMVIPVAGNASIKTIANNVYCARQNDVFWRDIKSSTTGGFNLSTLVSMCNGSTVFNNGVIHVINLNQVTVTTRTAGGAELIQSWTRIKN